MKNEKNSKAPSTEVINIDEMLKTIPIACSWCNKIYHIKQWQLAKGQRSGVSHGMCPKCEKEQRSEFEKLVEKSNK